MIFVEIEFSDQEIDRKVFIYCKEGNSFFKIIVWVFYSILVGRKY